MTLRVRTRLTLWHLAALMSIIAAFGGFLLLRLSHELRAGIDRDLRVEAAAVQGRLRSDPRSSLASIQPVPGTEETFALIVASDGSVVDSTADSPAGLALPVSARAPGLSTLRFEGEGGDVRVLVSPSSGGRTLVVGASLEPVSGALDHLLRIAAIGGAGALVLAGIGAWLLAAGALRPVEQMRREAEAIGASEPSRRLSPPVRDDEIGRLAATLNEMLGRLDAALRRERAFVAEASHDLRTPVAILRSEVELALQDGRTDEELRAALRSVADEADRLGRLTDDLMVLAQAGTPAGGRAPYPVELTQIVASSARRFQAVAGRARLTVAVGPPAFVRADGARLERCIDNLIDNAVHHSDQGGVVEIAVRRTDDSVVVEIGDDGPGVDPDVLPRLFEPFQRGASAYPGVGLGLAISRGIARAYGGDATFRPRPGGGSVFAVTMPAMPKTEAADARNS